MARRQGNLEAGPDDTQVESALQAAIEKITQVPDSRLEAMSKLVESGMSFPDAAVTAGLDVDTAFARSLVCPKMKGLFEASRGREVMDLRHKRFEETEKVSSAAVKQDFVRKLYLVGLFDKLVVLAAIADPQTTLGARILMHFSERVLPNLLPRESAVALTHDAKQDDDGDDLLKLRARLEKARDRIARLEQDKVNAERRQELLTAGPTGRKYEFEGPAGEDEYGLTPVGPRPKAARGRRTK